MKRVFFAIFILLSLIHATSLENGIGFYLNLGGGFDKRDINNDKTSFNISYGGGAIAYNINEYKIYYGIKAGGDFGKLKFKKNNNFNTLKIQGEIGYRFFPKHKTDIYLILGYEKLHISYDINSRNYTGFGFGIGAAKTLDDLFRIFADLTNYSVDNDTINDTINDTRLNIGFIIKD